MAHTTPHQHPPPSPPESTTTTTTTSSTLSTPTTSNFRPPIPPTAALPSLASTPLYTAPNTTTPIPFSTLYATPNQTTLLLFIRHFFCGNCQEYLRRLAVLIPPSTLPLNTHIIIIGFGSPTLIPSYIDALGLSPPFPYPIYAEPSKTLHRELGMHYTLSLGSKSPDYMQRSLVRVNLESTVQGLKRLWRGGGDALLGGDMRLNGGEFLVECDGEGSAEVSWCHRMGNSRGHVEVEVLRGVLGLHGREDQPEIENGVEHEHEDEKKDEREKKTETDIEAEADTPTPTEKSPGPPHPDLTTQRLCEKPSRPDIPRRRSTADRLRRSFSSRLGGGRRNGSVDKEKEKDGSTRTSSRTASRRRSPEPGMNAVREEVRSKDGGGRSLQV
jgi:hypothetical protein